MKICIVTTAFPRWENDSRAPFILEAAKSIARQGVEVKVIASHSPGAKTHEFIDEIEIYRQRYLPLRWENLHREPGGIPEAWSNQKFGKYAVFPFIFSQLIAVIRYTKDCDIIHANWTIAGFNAWINNLLFHIPYIITLQGSDIYKAANLSFAKKITFNIFKRAQKIITLSNSLKNEVMKFDNLENKIEVIPNGVNTRLFNSDSEDRENLLIYTGSLIKRKGVEFLVKAIPAVIDSYPDFRLMIIGEGNEENNLKDLVKSLSLSNHVKFLGQIDQNSVKEWLQKSKLFILPSIEEGQGVVLVEALACGTPCIGSDIGGIPDVISDDVGSLVPPENPKALSEAILFYLNNEDVWLKKSKNSRIRATQHFDWDVVGKKIVQLYYSLLPLDE
jgi:glycosyltransferase involved in cell wall biosynthesis